MGLTEFLLARIDEDEAREARGWQGVLAAAGDDVPANTALRHARALAECEAKRRIVTEGRSQCSAYGDPTNAEVADSLGVPEWLHYPDPDWRGHCDGCSAAQSVDLDREQVCKILATIYADHPDYRNEWKP